MGRFTRNCAYCSGNHGIRELRDWEEMLDTRASSIPLFQRDWPLNRG
jgi:hypothetical protein